MEDRPRLALHFQPCGVAFLANVGTRVWIDLWGLARHSPLDSQSGGYAMQTLCFSTDTTRARDRPALIRDVASAYFHLNVDLQAQAPESVFAEIAVSRTEAAARIAVNTSWSVVERSAAQARRCDDALLMIYRIQNGGSWFHNGQGEEFRTVQGSVVVGSQAAVYKAMAADGLAWGFQVLCVPGQYLVQSAPRIRARGFLLIDARAPLQRVLSAYLEHYFQEFDALDASQSVACLRALDLLLVACMAGEDEVGAELTCTLAQERHRKALQYMENNLLYPGLCPARVARHLCISERQLHRSFEVHGTSVSAEIRRLRLAYALEQLTHSPGLPVTQIAYQCGFDSLSTFYRAVKKAYGHTATELRAQGAA